jgi:hypothetical protein
MTNIQKEIMFGILTGELISDMMGLVEGFGACKAFLHHLSQLWAQRGVNRGSMLKLGYAIAKYLYPVLQAWTRLGPVPACVNLTLRCDVIRQICHLQAKK